MMPLNQFQRKCTGSNKFADSQEKFNILMCMDDIEQFSNNENESETFMQPVIIYS